MSRFAVMLLYGWGGCVWVVVVIVVIVVVMAMVRRGLVVFDNPINSRRGPA